MILTDKFVYIHEPKTGGTFVTNVLRRVLDPEPSGLLAKLSRRFGDPRLVDTNKHGSASEIPESHRDLPILGTVRHPLGRYVSQYHFGWWKEDLPPGVSLEEVEKRFPNFPDLTFEEFVGDFSLLRRDSRETGVAPEDRLGVQSAQFVRYFFKNPDIFPELDDDYIAARRWEQDMYPVHFMRTDRLNQDLHAFLLEQGHEPAAIDFILSEKKARPPGHPQAESTRTADWSKDRHWRDFYTPELAELVQHRERLLFAIFPDFLDSV